MRLRALIAILISAFAVVLSGASAAWAGDAFGYDEWAREVARRGIDPNAAVFPFEATPEMVAWAEEKVAVYRVLGAPKMLEMLQHELFYREQFTFSYEDNLTLTAIEAFEAQRGNCMAFTSLFVALSRGIGIPTFLVSVRRAPAIEKENDLVVVNRHVVAGYRGPDKLHLYDFYVTSDSPYIRHWIVDDVQASAMYHTNRGGAAIRENDFAGAIRHLETATALDPSWAPGWVNLGVAHYRIGDVDTAMAAYQEALRVDPENSSALTNMAVAYRSLGLRDEARAALLAAVAGQTNPWTLIALADV
jgi:tetratricopeptide (TPR) repeat protein